MSIVRPALSHRVLTSMDDIARERALWDRIVEKDYCSNPFLTMDWNLVWLRHFSEGRSVQYVRLAGPSGAVVGYFPLLIDRHNFHGLHVRRLSYAGNIYTPVNGPVVHEATMAEAVGYLVTSVLPALPWTLLQASNLPEEFEATHALECSLRDRGYLTHLEEVEGNWVWEAVTADSRAYFAALKHNIKNDTRRMQRRLSEKGSLRFSLVGSALRPSDIEAYRRVYANSWKESELDPSFHPDLIEVLASRGWLRLGLMYLDDRPIAAQLWLLRAGVGYVVKTAYDDEFGSFSPGTVLTWRIVERLMDDDGMHSFDYLKGDDAYKKHWTNRRRQRFRLTAFQKGASGRLLHALDRRWLPLIRRSGPLTRIKDRISRFMKAH